MLVLKKYILILVFLLTSSFAATATPTSFLPLEDGMSSLRRPVYGVSVEAMKPYRQTIAMGEESPSTFLFGSKDLLVCIFLIGVYTLFARKRARSRSAGI